jgi:hypothetical protein
MRQKARWRLLLPNECICLLGGIGCNATTAETRRNRNGRRYAFFSALRYRAMLDSFIMQGVCIIAFCKHNAAIGIEGAYQKRAQDSMLKKAWRGFRKKRFKYARLWKEYGGQEKSKKKNFLRRCLLIENQSMGIRKRAAV